MVSSSRWRKLENEKQQTVLELGRRFLEQQSVHSISIWLLLSISISPGASIKATINDGCDY